jgi:restriction endonuclease Mrr
VALPSEYDNKLWLAVLHELHQAGGRAKPSAIYPRMRAYFPEITDDDLLLKMSDGGNKWTNLIQWTRQHLVYRGCIDNTQRGIWTLTDLGRQWLLASWRGPDADYSQVKKPGLLRKSSPKRSPAAGQQQSRESGPESSETVSPATENPTRAPIVDGQPTHASPPSQGYLRPIVDPVETLCQRLVATQRQSQAPTLFEEAITEAFDFLGFEAQHIGGAGQTDVLARASLGQSSYSIVIDAKSTHTGKVPDSQISWPVIDRHRQLRAATFAAVIGEDFSGGQLQEFADQYRVTLITTSALLELVRFHASAPFNLHELKELFTNFGRADAALQALVERHKRNQRHWLLIADIIDTIERFQKRTPESPAPKIDNLYFYLTLNGSHSPADAPTLQDVTDAVAFLASRAVNVLVEVPGSSGAYQLAMKGSVARKRLTALARFFDLPRGIPGTASGQETLEG